jgi:hypothetical protein
MKFLFLGIFFFVGALVSAAPGRADSEHRIHDYYGFYTVINLTNKHANIDPTVFSQPVDGVFLKLSWALIEPTPGVYDFTAFDQAINLAFENHKKVELGVTTGGLSPSWLMQSPYNVQSSVFIYSAHGGAKHACQTLTIPWPWDTTYQKAYADMMRALADHVRSVGADRIVTNVKITGINTESEELHLPSSSGKTGDACTESDDVTIWQQAGYTPDKIINSYMSFMTAVAKAFPNRLLSQAILVSGDFPPISDSGQILSGENDPNYVDVKQAIVTEALQAYPGYFATNTTALTAYSQPTIVQTYAQQGAMTGFQTNDYLGINGGAGCGAPKANDGAVPCDSAGYFSILSNGIDNYSAKWIEVFEPNVQPFPDDIVAAMAALGNMLHRLGDY